MYTCSQRQILKSAKAPKVYFSELRDKTNNGGLRYGGIQIMKDLSSNLEQNCIPEEIFEMDIDNYNQLLVDRRKLMTKKIENYYYFIISKCEY